MCPPFEVLFHKIWYGDQWVFIRDKEAPIVKSSVKAPNLGKTGCFSIEKCLRYTDGWAIGRKVGIEKVKFFSIGRHIHVPF